MPAAARGDGTDAVLSQTGSGKDCKYPMMTATDLCSGNVYHNNVGAVRLGDLVMPHPFLGCAVDPSPLTAGSGNVFVNNLPAGRLGDPYTGDNVIIAGSGNVFING